MTEDKVELNETGITLTQSTLHFAYNALDYYFHHQRWEFLATNTFYGLGLAFASYSFYNKNEEFARPLAISMSAGSLFTSLFRVVRKGSNPADAMFACASGLAFTGWALVYYDKVYLPYWHAQRKLKKMKEQRVEI
ncbi:hypothetical protein O9G_005742 [Rozella allomycis CSF55]|uniref:Uncharacterized protein n=1 Tax=Rozella allomycis (strain CSF55) TaxID=988480 RepID=A0A075ARM1_ROZAC|nr:hypothetical protein O9G_005742 [Rozella allomycis CSF55]|eukprot:EPZ31371.1 hypothetical protein O9G_005742 [Rozella allomycis CSF55]